MVYFKAVMPRATWRLNSANMLAALKAKSNAAGIDKPVTNDPIDKIGQSTLLGCLQSIVAVDVCAISWKSRNIIVCFL